MWLAAESFWGMLGSMAVFFSVLGAGVWRGSKWLDKRFDSHLIETVRPAVREEIDKALAPVTVQLSHLHDCIERVGADAKANAAAATVEAHAAREASEALDVKIGQMQWRRGEPPETVEEREQ